MNGKVFYTLILVLLVVVCLTLVSIGRNMTWAVGLAFTPTSYIYLPIVSQAATPTPSHTPSPTSSPTSTPTSTPTATPTSTPTATRTPDSGQGIVADHSVVAQFANIPKSAVDQAGAIKTLFMHQSTGNNIDFLGLQCLAGLHGDPNNYPAECITYADNYPSGWPLYPQSWNWEGWPTPMADGRAKTDQFVSIVRSRQQDFAVLGMKFCYVDAWDQDFDYYRTQMEQLQSDYPTKTFIWATMVILGQVGETCYTGGWFNNCESIQLFNDQLRAYAGTHNIYFYDMADIESDGGRCYINGYRRYEILCPEYYDGWGGGGGGHPDVEGSIALAKGFWWLMARMSGWNGTSSSKP